MKCETDMTAAATAAAAKSHSRMCRHSVDGSLPGGGKVGGSEAFFVVVARHLALNSIAYSEYFHTDAHVHIRISHSRTEHCYLLACPQNAR